MRSPLPFWIAFILALTGTILTSLVALDIIPRDPPLWGKLAALAINIILWVNSVFTNPLRLATPTGQVIPMPTLAEGAEALALRAPPPLEGPYRPGALAPEHPTGTPISPPPSSHVAVVVDTDDGSKLPATPPTEPPKGNA